MVRIHSVSYYSVASEFNILLVYFFFLGSAFIQDSDFFILVLVI